MARRFVKKNLGFMIGFTMAYHFMWMQPIWNRI